MIDIIMKSIVTAKEREENNMNVIFVDVEGVLRTAHFDSLDDIERKIKTLGEICHEYDAKVVLEATSKIFIDEITLEADKNSEVYKILQLFKKYNIDFIGRTPCVERQIDESRTLPMWKEDEILLYLEHHPEFTHYCVIDDDDSKTIMHWEVSDLDEIRDHLVQTINYSDNYEEEGLLPKHKEEVGRILKKSLK